MQKILYSIKKLIPTAFYRAITRPYHYATALLSAIVCGFPSRNIFVIGITGTKGKSSTAEIINAILEEAGFTTALSNTIRFKIADETRRNLYKMTMPGRFFLQRFLKNAVQAGCDYAIIEMTSEGAAQYRHKWIALDALVCTNVTPEHIESHGSFENYLAAKLKLRDLLAQSPKKKKWVIANADDECAREFLNINNVTKLPFSLADARPYTTGGRGILMTVGGESIHSPLLGTFNIYNALAALAVAESQNIPIITIKKALERLERIDGRAEKIEAGQSFDVIVDYAHTSDSLEKLYTAFTESHSKGKKICVLGNTGGGRDKWKRPRMGEIADRYCNVIILTNEDPYDEDPLGILKDMIEGIKKHKPETILDRREAIRNAISRAKKNDVVLITGKGTDPFIMGPNGTKEEWDDKVVATEELNKLLAHH